MTPEVWMAKAERCLSSAELLLESGDPDAACNRSYYAMFNAARAALLIIGLSESAMSKTHSTLIGAFGLHIAKAELVPTEMGRLFSRESHRRLLSDYEGDGASVAEAQDSVANANRFVSAVRSWIELRQISG